MLIYGLHPVETALQQHPEQIQSLIMLDHTLNPRLQKIVSLAEKHHIKIQFFSKEKFFTLIKPTLTHQGVLAYLRQVKSQNEEDLMTLLGNTTHPLFLILDGIQDPHNLGACLRSANAAGVTAVIAPKDNACGLTPTVSKVACGAEQFTPFITVTNLARTLRELKKQGVWLIGLEEKATQSLYEMALRASIGLIFGSEGSGMRRLTKELCDFLVNIPMQGEIESLNISNACAISLFESVRQRL
ncbi:MAG: 23S rRNA (guanosine(2251)-2'-O)-methyltransferase RlmB [Gammaproteobacteria bacterium RIFCSPLOWO2_02_FULL_38_11]|nr:MAG: 23S rRNA (guanosine(2251)-2'-O)-methyltransferase RlmB [Gammaproteobacteria bacterium RIFCSPLOWO2_02_FULL_38_11]OGT77903.1 MAG: 23S rRNA (guanosine(2251)-2'-O)-methyltransferase RlmB [Gammaproteobacteria bacterium RIFCSPLOWO2_12_FULL_38_14]